MTTFKYFFFFLNKKSLQFTFSSSLMNDAFSFFAWIDPQFLPPSRPCYKKQTFTSWRVTNNIGATAFTVLQAERPIQGDAALHEYSLHRTV